MNSTTVDRSPALSPAVPDDRGGDGSEPLLGWRVWRVATTRTGWRRRGYVLRAISDDEPWPQHAPMLARCRSRSHNAPEENCRCGIYGMRDPSPPPYGLPSAGFVAVGRVALWGRVVVHETGYRAEFGYPQRLGFFCMRCLEERRAVRATVVVPDSPYGPLCEHHRGTRGEAVDPIMASLLDRYAIDPLPVEVLDRAVARAHEPAMDAGAWRGIIET